MHINQRMLLQMVQYLADDRGVLDTSNDVHGRTNAVGCIFWPQKDGAVHALSTVELLRLTRYLGIPWHPDGNIHTLGGLLS